MFSSYLNKAIRIIFFCIIFFAIATCKKDPAIHQQTYIPKHLKISVFIKNLQNPWGMEFLPNGDFLFLERGGNINLLKTDSADYNLIMFRNVQASEGGLLGLAIDPDFNNNHYIYIYETVIGYNQVVRLKFENDLLSQDLIILTGIPAAN